MDSTRAGTRARVVVMVPMAGLKVTAVREMLTEEEGALMPAIWRMML